MAAEIEGPRDVDPDSIRAHRVTQKTSDATGQELAVTRTT